MPTYRLFISYDGSLFSGWQSQPHSVTVQESIQKAFLKITGSPVDVIGASRTDAGVHALSQSAHVRLKKDVIIKKFQYSLNAVLPDGISILRMQKVGASFHAIRDAGRKKYRYLIWNHPVENPLLKRRAWHCWESLDIAAMRKAASFLIGKHDFSAFRAADSDTKTSVRTIRSIYIRKEKLSHFSTLPDSLIAIECIGDGFLKHMVRTIVGTLVEVGRGQRKPESIQKILRSKDRKMAGITAPPDGLYLVHVDY